jgi:hypothetical protein
MSNTSQTVARSHRPDVLMIENLEVTKAAYCYAA